MLPLFGVTLRRGSRDYFYDKVEQIFPKMAKRYKTYFRFTLSYGKDIGGYDSTGGGYGSLSSYCGLWINGGYQAPEAHNRQGREARHRGKGSHHTRLQGGIRL